MQSLWMKMICIGLIGALGFTGCASYETKEKGEIDELAIHSEIVVNKIENLASAKMMAESKVIGKDVLPDDLKGLTNLTISDGIVLSMISEIYTKSDMTKEEFDVLHDYHFLYADDAEKSVIIHASQMEAPLRDYFFQAENAISEVYGVDVIISQYEEKYIAQFEHQGTQFDVETNGISQSELVELLQKIIAR